jgi:uncharacterized damage-inducible protein DinB
MTPEYFVHLALYNQWANQRLFQACSELSSSDYLGKRPAFFGSIHRTLDHILGADLIWFGRLTGTPFPADFDQLYDNFDSLHSARQLHDQKILAWMQHLSSEKLHQKVSYTTSRNEEFTDSIIDILPHMFNHQTHHRGQVHGLLSQTDVAPPSLDLIYFQRHTSRTLNTTSAHLTR